MQFAALLAIASLVVAAQQPTGSRVEVEGCINQAQRDGSLAGSGVGTTASPNTAATEANSGELVDEYLLTDATPLAPRGPEPADRQRARYALDGKKDQLAAHLGQRVEIIGTVAPPKSSGRGVTSEGLSSGDRRIIVEAVKRLGSGCSTSTER
jgi:hypothetical protein